jgi:hypothetical protein
MKRPQPAACQGVGGRGPAGAGGDAQAQLSSRLPAAGPPGTTLRCCALLSAAASLSWHYTGSILAWEHIILLHRTNTADQADGPEIALVIR